MIDNDYWLPPFNHYEFDNLLIEILERKHQNLSILIEAIVFDMFLIGQTKLYLNEDSASKVIEQVFTTSLQIFSKK